MSLPEERSRMVGIGFELVVVVLVWLSYSDKTRGRCGVRGLPRVSSNLDTDAALAFRASTHPSLGGFWLARPTRGRPTGE